MELPPIVPYAFQRLPRILTPIVVVFVAQKVTETHLGIVWPTWSLAIYVLSLPITLTLSILYKDWKDARDAAALGAVLPPQVYDKWPGGLAALTKMVSNFKEGYISEMITEWAGIYGYTFNVRILFENRVVTAEPDYLKLILATTFDGYEKGPVFEAQMDSLLGTGVFNSDGDMWKFHRSMTRPFFSKDRISHFELFDRMADNALSQLKTRLKEGYPVDAQDLASRFTLDSATEFLFGQDVRSLSAGLPYPYYSPLADSVEFTKHPANEFAKAFGEAQSCAALRSRYGVNWPLAEPFRDRTAKHMRVVKKFIEPILAEAVERKKAMGNGDVEKSGSGEREVKEGETLLDHLVNYTNDRKVLLDEILNIMIAGRDTTANTITFSIYMMSQHPDALKRLREEIITKIGPSKRPTYEDIREMKYLRAFINEVLRLYPAVPANVRTSRQAALWPSKTGGKPLYIPAGTKLPYSVFVMHRRTDLWGPDAEVFDPDRFLDERLHKYLTPNPFIFLPFNAGPRICLGQQFAYQETSFFLIRLLQNFSSIALAPNAQPPETRPPSSWANAPGTKGTEKIMPKAHLTMYAWGGVWVTMEEASYE